MLGGFTKFHAKQGAAMSAHGTASAAARRAQIRGPVEFPKYVTVAGKPELARDAEHEAELLAANGTSPPATLPATEPLMHASESTSNSEQLVRTPLERISAPAIGKPHVLLPFDIREALSISDAARIAGRTAVTVRTWAALHDLGRPIGRRWMVSRVALAMHLDGDREALKAYLAGDRESALVTDYFQRFGLQPQKIWKENVI
jgi:hypothetical protein